LSIQSRKRKAEKYKYEISFVQIDKMIILLKNSEKPIGLLFFLRIGDGNNVLFFVFTNPTDKNLMP